jgi:Uma2 family endonuclease
MQQGAKPMAAEAGLLDHPWVKRHKLDVSQYHRMGETGVFEGNERVELIEGEIVEMAPIGDRHAGTTNRLARALFAVVGDRAVVAVGNPVRLDRYNEPQPDFTLLRPRADFYETSKPAAGDTLLMIEVAESSLRYDRKVKLPLYARHGVPEVWIVDLEGGTVEVCREPRGDGYAATSHVAPGDVLEPALLPGVRIAVTDIIR